MQRRGVFLSCPTSLGYRSSYHTLRCSGWWLWGIQTTVGDQSDNEMKDEKSRNARYRRCTAIGLSPSFNPRCKRKNVSSWHDGFDSALSITRTPRRRLMCGFQNGNGKGHSGDEWWFTLKRAVGNTPVCMPGTKNGRNTTASVVFAAKFSEPTVKTHGHR